MIYNLYLFKLLNPFIFLIPHKFQESFFYKNKKPFSKGQGAEISKLPRQNDFRTFCMSEETEKAYHELEEVIGIC